MSALSRQQNTGYGFNDNVCTTSTTRYESAAALDQYKPWSLACVRHGRPLLLPYVRPPSPECDRCDS